MVSNTLGKVTKSDVLIMAVFKAAASAQNTAGAGHLGTCGLARHRKDCSCLHMQMV